MAELSSAGTVPPQAESVAFTIGNYDVIRRLAVGGMAEIFLAWQRGSGGFRRRVVLKRIHPHLAQDAEFVQMFQNEARLAAALNHPNIVHVYDVSQGDGGELYIVMEYLRGEPLQSVLRQLRSMSMPLPLPYAMEIVLRLCDALDAAHSCLGCESARGEIIHRDVTPSNIFVSYEGQVKLLDFGIAKAMAHAEATQAGRLKGKYPYMSPEQFTGIPLDRRTDIFSLGAVLWEMSTGKRLFRAMNEFEIAQKILGEPATPPSAVVADYPPALEHIVMRCLERDRNLRYSTVRQVAEGLEEESLRRGWALKPAALGAFMQAIFAERYRTSVLDGEAAVGTGPGSVPSGVSGPPVSTSGVVPADHRLSLGSANLGPPVSGVPGAAGATASASLAPRSGALSATFSERAFLVAFALVTVGSALFWTLIFPRM